MTVATATPVTLDRYELPGNLASLAALAASGQVTIRPHELIRTTDGRVYHWTTSALEIVSAPVHHGTVANVAALDGIYLLPSCTRGVHPGDTAFVTAAGCEYRVTSGVNATAVWAACASIPTIPTTPSEVGADPSGTAATAVSTHNTATDSHADLRTLIDGKQPSLTISTVGTALLNISPPAAQKIPRINPDASITLIDVPSGGGGTSFEPSSILGLRAHYDPSVAGSCLGSTLAPLSSEGACRRWLDLTGNGRHLEEANAAYQATFKPAFVNGVAALDMRSSGRFSRVLNLGTEGYPEITIYMLRARKVSGAAWGNWFTNTADYAGPNKLNAHAPYSSGDSYFDYGNDTSYRLNPGYGALSYDHTSWHSLAFIRSRQRMMLFVNGSLESASSIQAPLTAFTASAATLYFGNYTTPQPANAYFGPLLMIGRALTPYELGLLDTYYSARGYR